jgi:hypothetical protein
MRRIDITAVVPDVGDDDTAEWTGEIDADAARSIVSRVKSHADRVGRRLPRSRVRGFASGHGHDLLAHDHEAVVENSHHHDEEDGQDERKLDKGLALAPAPPRPELSEIRKGLHGSPE